MATSNANSAHRYNILILSSLIKSNTLTHIALENFALRFYVGIHVYSLCSKQCCFGHLTKTNIFRHLFVGSFFRNAIWCQLLLSSLCTPVSVPALTSPKYCQVGKVVTMTTTGERLGCAFAWLKHVRRPGRRLWSYRRPADDFFSHPTVPSGGGGLG